MALGFFTLPFTTDGLQSVGKKWVYYHRNSNAFFAQLLSFHFIRRERFEAPTLGVLGNVGAHVPERSEYLRSCPLGYLRFYPRPPQRPELSQLENPLSWLKRKLLQENDKCKKTDTTTGKFSRISKKEPSVIFTNQTFFGGVLLLTRHAFPLRLQRSANDKNAVIGGRLQRTQKCLNVF